MCVIIATADTIFPKKMLQISLVFLQQGLVIMLLNTLFLMLLREYLVFIFVSVERSNVAGSDSCDG